MKLKTSSPSFDVANRLYKLSVPVIGLTGGIATGKSTVAELLKAHNIPVINADLLVKEIYKKQKTIDLVKALAPEVYKSQQIDFKLLREKFFTNSELKAKLEHFIYQELPMAFNEVFQSLNDPKLVVYDVPLLFEKKMEKYFDLTVLVYAPRKIQRARLMERDGHLEDMAETILKQQIDIEEKKLKADYVINNSFSKEELVAETSQFLQLHLDL